MIDIKCDICGKLLSKNNDIYCMDCYHSTLYQNACIIHDLHKITKKLKEENDFLLKRVEELESHLCPACSDM